MRPRHDRGRVDGGEECVVSADEMTVIIADVDPFEVYDKCPVCDRKGSLCKQTCGPLTDWTECLDCNRWFHPQVTFEFD